MNANAKPNKKALVVESNRQELSVYMRPVVDVFGQNSVDDATGLEQAIRKAEQTNYDFCLIGKVSSWKENEHNREDISRLIDELHGQGIDYPHIVIVSQNSQLLKEAGEKGVKTFEREYGHDRELIWLLNLYLSEQKSIFEQKKVKPDKLSSPQ